MPEQTITPEPPDHAAAAYSYPRDLARFVRERWCDAPQSPGGGEPLDDGAALESFCCICYQASLLREEERPITFRAILAAPELFAPEGRPPEGLQRLEFSRSLPCDPAQLQRLSVAADPDRTLIAVRREAAGNLRIWGLLNSGTRWLRDSQGGRRPGAPLPRAPVVHIDAPGSMAVHQGYDLIGKLHHGRLSGSRADLFESQWLPAQFTQFLSELIERHDAARNRAGQLSGETWAPLEPGLTRRVVERMMKRVISVVRDARHGGTILFVPSENVGCLCGDDPDIDIKYRFADGRSRVAFPDLIVDILNRLAQVYGDSDRRRPEAVGWREFETTTDDEITTLDEALFESAHLIAGLAAVDGAVVMTKQHDLLGFGGMISGRLSDVRTVARALDLEGDRVVQEDTGNVGARHRSAYRLAGAFEGAVAVVISQDGGVRFVCQTAGRVTYWEQE